MFFSLKIKCKILFNNAIMLFGGSRVFSLNFSFCNSQSSKIVLFNFSDFKLPFKPGMLCNVYLW